MKVLKFGGTSVGSVKSLANVKKIIEAIPGKAIIVVSALGGLTDKLISTAKLAFQGDNQWKTEMDSIRTRHFDIINEIIEPRFRENLIEIVKDLLNGLEENYKEVFISGELSEKKLDEIVSFGERISSHIVAALIRNGKRYDSLDFMSTEKWYGKNIIKRDLTDKKIKDTFKHLEEEEKAIVPGFISRDCNTGEITNLGRGGSDFSGALIAAALGAEVLEIWTDVDGFMTADPRIVKDAIVIDHLTFTESMELCTFGAKVIYPPTIFPVFHNNIPIKILNTFNPEAPGTLITDHAKPEDLEIKGVTSLKDVSLITLDIKGKIESKNIIKRVLNLLSDKVVKIIPVNNPEPDQTLKFALVASDYQDSLNEITHELANEISSGEITKPIIENNLTALAIVGRNMKSKNRLAARIGHSLVRNGINIKAYAVNSNTTLIYIIKQEECTKALPLIHSLLF